MLLPIRDSKRTISASPSENPIFMKAEMMPPRKRKASPKIRIKIKRRRNVRLKGI